MSNDFTPRLLTDGEKAVARSIFGNKLNLDTVQIKPWGWMNKASSHNGLTRGQVLFGDIYIKGAAYSDDYSKASPEKQRLYRHELAHVWQYQTRPFSLAAEAVAWGVRGYSKAYVPPEKLRTAGNANEEWMMQFSELNLEQQANIIAGYYTNKDDPRAQKIAGRMMMEAGLFLESLCPSTVPNLVSVKRDTAACK